MSKPITEKWPRGRAWLEVDHAALARNAKRILSLLSPGVRLMAVVKADAYGHGLSPVARSLLSAGAAALGVATLEEGLALRDDGIDAPILVLGYLAGAESILAAADRDLMTSVCSIEHLGELDSALATGHRSLAVHAKIDTGMTRLGTLWGDAAKLYEAIAQTRNVRLAGVFSHLAEADSTDITNAALQRSRFDEAVLCLKRAGPRDPCLHLANSAGTLADPSFHYDLVRVGLCLYGVLPAAHLAEKIELDPVLSMQGIVTQVKRVPAGSRISYGGTFVAETPMTTAVVAIGYGDGVPVQLSNRMEALVRGRRVPQVGRVTMDQLVLDVSAVPDVQSGDVATLLGRDGSEHVSVEDWSEMMQTIPWEVLCLFKQRLPRVAVDPPSGSFRTNDTGG